MTWIRDRRLVPVLTPETWVTRLRNLEPYGPDPIVFGPPAPPRRTPETIGDTSTTELSAS